MAFKTTAQVKSDSAPKFDWEALQNYKIETCGLENPETLVGYVSMIVDLGNQEQPDAEMVFTGSEDDEAAEIESRPATYFKDGQDEKTKKAIRLKCWPQPPKQAVAFAVDFPEIQLDLGQFFDDDSGETKPLRLWLGGQFWLGADIGMVVAQPTFLKVNNKTGKWSFDAKHLCYKMAVDSSPALIKAGEPFVPEQIDQLLGQAFQFKAQVFNRENKGKSYFTEKCSYVGKLARSQTAPEITTPLHLVQLDEDNNEEAIRYLPNHVINTIKQANNFAGSKIEKQIENRYESKSDESTEGEVAKPIPAPKPAKVTKPAVKKAPAADIDDDIPF